MFKLDYIKCTPESTYMDPTLDYITMEINNILKKPSSKYLIETPYLIYFNGVHCYNKK